MGLVTAKLGELSRGCFYLAGPFFNLAQINLIEQIEIELGLSKYQAFSPRLQDGNGKPAVRDAAWAKDIYERNKAGLELCGRCIAVIDWLLPANREVRVVEPSFNTLAIGGTGMVTQHNAASPPLNIPDAGSVWEMGYLDGRSKDVYVFTTRPKEAGVNLMLTVGAKGVIYGLEALRQFLACPNLEAGVSKWEGGFR